MITLDENENLLSIYVGEGDKLIFEDDALNAIATKATERGVGACGLRGIIEEVMLPLQYSCPSKENLESVTKQ